MLTISRISTVLALAAGLWAHVALAQDKPVPTAQAPTASPVVYLTPFELDAADLTLNSGPRSRVGNLLGNLLPSSPLRPKSDPATRSAQIVALMTQTLQADLQKNGIDARILPPGSAWPTSGWLVRGVFLSADEGNRLRRAVIGLNSGQAQLQVAAALDALSETGAPAPLYSLTEQQASTPIPGAIVTLNPYVAATKFALDAHDLDAETKRVAQKIADQVAAKVR